MQTTWIKKIFKTNTAKKVEIANAFKCCASAVKLAITKFDVLYKLRW